MSKESQNEEIISQIALDVANEKSKETADKGVCADLIPPDTKDDADISSSIEETHIFRSKDKNKSLSIKDLQKMKGLQNLAERKALLFILGGLFAMQLLFMNAVVIFIVLWSIFDWEAFRILDTTTLSYLIDFTKYYITAVLVELLGGIIYIVQRVFSEKIFNK